MYETIMHIREAMGHAVPYAVVGFIILCNWMVGMWQGDKVRAQDKINEEIGKQVRAARKVMAREQFGTEWWA